jgi:hypothetical protein
MEGGRLNCHNKPTKGGRNYVFKTISSCPDGRHCDTADGVGCDEFSAS